MRIKAQVTSWEGINDNHLQDLLKLFFNESRMYLYGCFNGDTYNHLAGNFQSDKVYTIPKIEEDEEPSEETVEESGDSSTSEEPEVNYKSSDLNAYTLDIPYESTAVDYEDLTASNVLSYNLVGDEKSGMFPDIDTKLVKRISDLFLLNYKKDGDDTAVKAYKEALPLYHDNESHSIVLYPYLGAVECDDEMVKPSDIKKGKNLLKIAVNQQYSQSTDVIYDLRTESFTCYIKKSTTNSAPTRIDNLHYKIGIVPFTVEESRKVTYYNLDLEDFVNDYKLILADENVTIDDRRTFLFYLKKNDIKPEYKLTQLLSSTQNYYNVPLSAMFPLYTDDTQIKGIVYMRLYNGNSPYIVDAGDVIEFSSFDDGTGKSIELSLSLEEYSSENESEESTEPTP